MDVNKIGANVSFGYSHQLKTLFKKGKLPTVKKGFYGGDLSIDTVSLEHMQPHSQGGRTILENLVLATKKNNNARGNASILDFCNVEHIKTYLKQFEDVVVAGFVGNEYIKKITKTLKNMGVNL